jgi:ABC-type uncharacterized transport system ATPase subunit
MESVEELCDDIALVNNSKKILEVRGIPNLNATKINAIKPLCMNETP